MSNRDPNERVGTGSSDPTGQPATDKPMIQGCGLVLVFFLAQLVAGSMVFAGVIKALQASVPAWRNDPTVPYIIAAIPALVVVGLLERWCMKLAEQGPITWIIVLALAAGSIS